MRIELMKKVAVMRVLKALIICLISVILFQIILQNKIHADQKKVLRISDRKTIRFEQMIRDLKNTSLVFVGETHTMESHHRSQLDVIKALYNVKVPIAVGFEMFVEGSQGDLDQWIDGSLPLDKFIKIYYKNWNFPWLLYKDIFFYIKENKIPAIALNVSSEIIRKVSQSGFASLTKEELEKLPPETGCVVSEKYMRFIRRAYAMHGHRGKQFLYFCEAQLLWDQVMAQNLLEFHKKNPERILIVITGSGHAWKMGIPGQIRELSENIRYRVLLPHVPGRIDLRTITLDDADYIVFQQGKQFDKETHALQRNEGIDFKDDNF